MRGGSGIGNHLAVCTVGDGDGVHRFGGRHESCNHIHIALGHGEGAVGYGHSLVGGGVHGSHVHQLIAGAGLDSQNNRGALGAAGVVCGHGAAGGLIQGDGVGLCRGLEGCSDSNLGGGHGELVVGHTDFIATGILDLQCIQCVAGLGRDGQGDGSALLRGGGAGLDAAVGGAGDGNRVLGGAGGAGAAGAGAGAGGAGAAGAFHIKDDIAQADPAVCGAAPVAVDLFDGDAFALLIVAQILGTGGGTFADIQIGGGDGSHGTGGDINASLEVAHADPAGLDAGPVAAGLIVRQALTGGDVSKAIIGGAGAGTDVQGGDTFNQTVSQNRGLAVGDDAGGGAAGAAAHADILQVDPALVGTTPAAALLQNGDLVALLVNA